MVSKEQIINELKEKNIVECEMLKGLDWSYFNKNDKGEINEAIFENIKRNHDGWSIKKVCVFKGFGVGGYKSEELMLVYQSVQMKYDDEGFLRLDYRKMLSKSQFSEQQWAELEAVIRSQNQQQDDNVAQVEQSLKNWFPFFRNPNSKH